VSGTERRLENLKKLLEQARERLRLDIGFVLWEGSTVPAGLPRDALATRTQVLPAGPPPDNDRFDVTHHRSLVRFVVHDNSAPRPRIKSTKPGKLVAMKLASSIFTGFSLASPSTSAAMAIR
jgi:hypothetical protein